MILPADSYVVVNKTIVTSNDRKIITDLYQPIIGNKAVSLYFTLLNDLEKKDFITKELTHHHLQSIMQISLEEIVNARERLEGVGRKRLRPRPGIRARDPGSCGNSCGSPRCRPPSGS